MLYIGSPVNVFVVFIEVVPLIFYNTCSDDPLKQKSTPEELLGFYIRRAVGVIHQKSC